MTNAIQVEHLIKSYNIAHKLSRDTSLRGVVERRLRGAANRALRRSTQPDAAPEASEAVAHAAPLEVFRALDDVSFDVAVGERIGVIGANGAGKSTLLKILSRITEPTSGRVSIRGRVASLLEVGTGFHPELSGRENIFLNGAILGMPRSEIRKKFDEIVAFSEVERFIDTPVKYFSSGMYVRLAFSVSAHLEPDVLILDEVLAVGDARFQRKCLNQMRRFSDTGRTVLFVSHSAVSISQFCSSAIHLEGGRIKRMGPAQQVVEAYQAQSILGVDAERPPLIPRSVPETPVGDDIVRIEQVTVLDEHGELAPSLGIGEAAELALTFQVLRQSEHILVPNFHIRNFDGVYVAIATPPDALVAPLAPGRYTARCRVPAHLLNNGIYTIQAAISSFNRGQTVHADLANALVFEIADDLSDLSRRHGYMQEIPGVVRPYLDWSLGAAA